MGTKGKKAKEKVKGGAKKITGAAADITQAVLDPSGTTTKIIGKTSDVLTDPLKDLAGKAQSKLLGTDERAERSRLAKEKTAASAAAATLKEKEAAEEVFRKKTSAGAKLRASRKSRIARRGAFSLLQGSATDRSDTLG